jgi:hypothetical protein
VQVPWSVQLSLFGGTFLRVGRSAVEETATSTAAQSTGTVANRMAR